VVSLFLFACLFCFNAFFVCLFVCFCFFFLFCLLHPLFPLLHKKDTRYGCFFLSPFPLPQSFPFSLPIQVDIFNGVSVPAFQAGWYDRVSSSPEVYRLNIGFRTADPCDPDLFFPEKIGDTLFVKNNRGLANFRIPLTAAGATRAGFVKGSCISGE